MCTAGLLFGAAPVWAAQSAGPPTAQSQAAFDATGYWVSLITQNWRWRMVVPGRGEYADVPINAKARQMADAWNPATDAAAGKQCEAYGAAVIMRNPERLHITWVDSKTLKVDTDEGMQTRLLHFQDAIAASAVAAAPLKPLPASAPPSWQGQSSARWVLAGAGGLLEPDQTANGHRYGSLEVVTSNMLPGLLRKNGVPYGAKTKTAEYWNVHELGGQEWMSISTTVEDPEYLQGPYIYDSVFQKEPESAKWAPAPCTLGS